MSFASVLDAYCNATGCTNKEIAEACGISPSTLSRYRNGERIPDMRSDALDSPVAGIMALSDERDLGRTWRKDIIRSAFEASLAKVRPIGANFGSRLNMIMALLNMRNTEVAHALGVSPSYVSRIRSGQRMASGQRSIAESFSQVAAQRCVELKKTDELISIVDPTGEHFGKSYLDFDSQVDLARIIERWLFNNNTLESDLKVVQSLFDKLNLFYFLKELEGISGIKNKTSIDDELNESARFYYGIDEMKKAERLFFDLCVQRSAEEVYLSSDMPLLETAMAPDFASDYRQRIGALVNNKARIVVIHSLDRSLAEMIVALELWLPLYLTDHVRPLYLKDMDGKLFSHVNYVSDACALSAEAVLGHRENGRYYLTTKTEDVKYYRQKMSYILEHASSMLEICRDSDPDQRARFEEFENAHRGVASGHAVGVGSYENLDIMSYPGDCAAITIKCDPAIHLIIRQPKLRFVINRMK